MKRNIVCLGLILTILAALVVPAYAAEDAEITAASVEQTQEDGPIYTSVIDKTYADGTTGFVYSDDMLLHSSYEKDGDLCKVSVALAGAAYADSGDNVRNMLEPLGYSCHDYDYDSALARTLSDNDYVAFNIASKRLDDGKILYFVVIRGTHGLEWFSDFNMPDPDEHDGYHVGFYKAYLRVKTRWIPC